MKLVIAFGKGVVWCLVEAIVLHSFCKPIWCFVVYDTVQMHFFLNANACNVLCCVAIMVEASKGWIGELDAWFGGPQLLLNCIIKLGWFLYFFHKLHKGTLIKMATTWEIFGNTCWVFTTCVSFHLIILPKTQQPIFEKNPKKRKKKKKEEAG